LQKILTRLFLSDAEGYKGSSERGKNEEKITPNLPNKNSSTHANFHTVPFSVLQMLISPRLCPRRD
jgi:hypothetical protein